MSFKCIHLSDVHFRGLSRHEEYREYFLDFFEKARNINPDLIFVGGDIVHSKTQGISPELIDILSWWFEELAKVAPTHVILGNHDGLISNPHRQDAISPIISALNNSNLHLYKDSGTYSTGIPGFNWGVFSCFDEENWENVKPVEGEVNIALFHGGVLGSFTDINWEIEGEVEHTFFKDFEFAFLGDIHKFQFLNESKTIAYPGSTIQQNYGEDPGKGFLVWDIRSADDFDVDFVEVFHSKPFATIDWKDTVVDTVRESSKYPDGSRFRIRSQFQIPQTEIKHLYSELKEKKKASEIVFKFDDIKSQIIESSTNDESFSNFRDPSVILDLLKQYYKEASISEEEWQEISVLLKKYTGSVIENDTPRNVKWSIKKLQFDNVFSYGKNNVINFDSLHGVVGLFGKNRSGKSSIPGSIMYGLYNTTDRGSIKNLHVINTRKGHCKVELDFLVNGVCHRLERQSVKHQNRRGEINAVTHLNLYRVDTNGELKDLSGGQRRETDAILRSLVGTYEDFMLTSFASQGGINTFIKHRATKRKEILASFLDLNIFETILNNAKEDSIHIKALLDKSPEREWNTLILEKGLILKSLKEERLKIDSDLASANSKIQEIKVESASSFSEIITEADLTKSESEISENRERISELNSAVETNQITLDNLDAKLTKIDQLKNQFPIDQLKEKYGAQLELEKTLLVLEGSLDQEKSTLKNKRDSISLLDQVPCGDKFPTCKFIKRSHLDKSLIEEQVNLVENIEKQIQSAKKAFSILLDEDLKSKIDKYQNLLEKESNFKIERSTLEAKSREAESAKDRISLLILELEKEYESLKSRVDMSDKSERINSIKIELMKLEKTARDLDAQRISTSESIGLTTSELAKLKEEKTSYENLLMEWRIYEILMNGVNKKGIPLHILTMQLPKINKEIAKILHGVVEFTVELEADLKSNSMDVFINYGDSKRIIECASGMEKMISSIAIRVALVNVSSLPKCDTFIIDEGFGALDETNVEACNRLLQSLKKWFKNILVISHVDAVKDSVDTILDIFSKGIDSQVIHE